MKATSLEFSRNLGFLSTEEQQKLNDSTVAIAGAGGDGGMLAVQLARLGVGSLRLADPDPFETENINRQAVCTTKTIGVNKAEAVGAYVSTINPSINVEVYSDGVTAENVGNFVGGSDLLIDETEFTIHAIGVMLAREARKNGIPNLMALNIGFGTTVTTFHPEGKTFEDSLGLSEDAPLEEIANQHVDLSRWLAYIPPYADLEVFKKVAAGEKSAPSIAPGVAIAAAVGSTQAFLNLVSGIDNNRPKPVYAPKVMMIDALSGESKVIRNPRLSSRIYLGKMIAKNLLKRVPKTDY